jgi:HEAT repeat protein
MGLLDKLGITGTREEKEARAIAKLSRKAMEKFGPPENRQGAIEELGALKSEAAVEALLLRFTFRVDPGITDDEEKQHAHALVVEAGPAALPAVKRFILGRDEISWPLRALGELLPEAEVLAVLIEALRKAANEYSRVPEKKVLLLHAISHHRSPQVVPAAVPFLEDMDDEVQIAAAQAIASQASPSPGPGAAPGSPAPPGSEAGREPLIHAFLRAHDQSNARVREALAAMLAEAPWDVKGYTPKVEAALPPAYKLDARGKVQRKV